MCFLGDFIKPVCLPYPGERFPPKTTCVVGGWGRITESEKSFEQHSNNN